MKRLILFLLIYIVTSCKSSTYHHTFKKEFYYNILIVDNYVTKKKKTNGEFIKVDEFHKALIYLTSVTQMAAQVKESNHNYIYDNDIDMKEDIKKWDKWFRKYSKKMNQTLVDSLINTY